AVSGQPIAEANHAVVLGRATHLPPASVVAVLLAAPVVTASRLQVPVGRPADPDVVPRRGDCQSTNALLDPRVGDGLTIGRQIAEAAPPPHAPDAGSGIGHVA